jgi:uncharacterized membrane protein
MKEPAPDPAGFTLEEAAMLTPLVISLAIGIFLLYLQIPVLCRRVHSSESYPCLILIEVGFTVGLIVIVIAPFGLLFPDGRAIWIAANLAGLSLVATTGVAALWIVQMLKMGANTLSLRQRRPGNSGFHFRH